MYISGKIWTILSISCYMTMTAALMSDDDEWSSSDDDKDLLLVDKLFPENPSLHVLIPKRNLEDISDEQCGMLFRYVNVIFLYIYYRFEVVLFCFILLLAIILFIIY